MTLDTPTNDHAVMVDWTEDDVLKHLWRHFAARSWACIPQISVAMVDLADQHQLPDRLGDPDRRIDMLTIRRSPQPEHGPLETLALEVKVTRQDFWEDVRNPSKQATWRQAATRIAFVVPAGVITASEVPEWAGLAWVKAPAASGWAEVEWIREPPYTVGHAPQPVPRVIFTLAARIAARDAHARGWNALPAATLGAEELRGALTAAETAVMKANRAQERAEKGLEAWKSAYLALNPAGHPCEWCSRPVKPLKANAGGFKGWVHLDRSDDEACRAAEIADLEVTARLDWGAADARDRNRRVTLAHRAAPDGFDPAVEAEPWRAYITVGDLRGPQPTNVFPATDR